MPLELDTLVATRAPVRLPGEMLGLPALVGTMVHEAGWQATRSLCKSLLRLWKSGWRDLGIGGSIKPARDRVSLQPLSMAFLIPMLYPPTCHQTTHSAAEVGTRRIRIDAPQIPPRGTYGWTRLAGG